MKPLPWSYSSLNTFKTCPRKYEAEVVLKSVPKEEPSEMQLYGIRIHKAFEDHQLLGTPLTPDLRIHQPYMDALRKQRVGEPKVERKVALNRKLEPCGFFDPEVWWRGVIDYDAEIGHGAIKIVDYKTGKVRNEFTQLKCFALYKFMEGAERVSTEFYWTQTQSTTPLALHRNSIKDILDQLKPDLAQLREAFRSEIWQPRQNGLCRKWCAVTDCEFNGLAR